MQATGNLRAFRECPHLAHGARLQNAVSGKNERPRGARNQFQRLVEILPGCIEHGMGTVRLCRRRCEIEVRARLLRVLGDIHQNWTWPSRIGYAEGLPQRRRDVLRAGDEVVVFRNRQRHTGNVHFLKGVGAEQLGRNLSRDADQRNGVEHRSGDTGHHIGGARTGGGQRNARAAGGARIAVGHVDSALLVPCQDVPDGKFAQRIVGREG